MPRTKKSITPQELKEKITLREPLTLLDVREPEEFEICHIDGSILTPFSEISDHLPDFNKDDEYVVICKQGARSEEALKLMKKKGFVNLKNLDGGIMKWAKDIERTMELY